MMSIVAALVLIASLVVIGWLLVTLIGVRNRWEKAGLSFIVGSWLVTVEMMIAYQLFGFFSPHISLTAIVLTIGVELLALRLSSGWGLVRSEIHDLVAYMRGLSQALPTRFQNTLQTHPIQLGLMVLSFGFLAYTLMSNWIWPVSDWDAIALYDFRAQLIRLAGSWSEGKALGYFYHYPPFTSLWHGLFYQVGFERVKILYTLLFSCFLVVSYQLLRSRTTVFKTWLGVFLLTFAPLTWGHVMVAYTNLPYTIYFCLAVFYAINWFQTRHREYFWLSLILLAGSAWIRQSEPFWILVVGLLILGSSKKKSLKTWLVTAFGLTLFGIFFKYWPMYTTSLNLPPPPISVNDALGYFVPLNLATVIHHTFLVTDHVLKSVVEPIKWVLLPTLLVVLFDREFWRNQTSRLVALLLFVMSVMIWGGTFYFSFTYKSWHLIGESLTRLTMVAVPLMIVIIAQSSLWHLGESRMLKAAKKPPKVTKASRR